MYNDKLLLDRRKDLRNNPTETEKIIWQRLNRKQLGVRFFRQYSVGPYILDFYCPIKRLAIEIDGPSHETIDARIYDKERNVYLASLDIRTIRFKNNEVTADLNSIITKIRRAVTSP